LQKFVGFAIIAAKLLKTGGKPVHAVLENVYHHHNLSSLAQKLFIIILSELQRLI
jgi:hypothetical protein